MSRHRLILAVKIALSGGIIYALGRRFETKQLLDSLHHIDAGYLLASIFCAGLATPVVGYRWTLLAKMVSVPISFAEAVSATFAGLFVGQVLPGAIGADLVRGWMVWKAKAGSNARMVASLVLDRVVSLGAVGLMIVAALPFLSARLPQDQVVWVAWSLAGLAGCLVAGYLGLRLFGAFSKNAFLRKWINRFHLRKLRISLPQAAALAGLGVVGHMAVIFSAYLLSRAVGMESPLWMWIVVMPVVILASAFPISINGWGVREFVMVHLWASFGFQESEAFLTSVCLGTVAILSSLPGIWFYLKRKSDKPRESLDAYSEDVSKRLA